MHVGRILLPIFLLVNAFLAMGCAKTTYSTDSIPAAAGRFSAVTSAYPGVVMVITPSGSGLCTGVMVSQFAVLTATHCVLSPGEYTVRTSLSEFYTSHIERHGVGDVNDTQDISLLIFTEPLTPNIADVYSIADRAAVGDAVTVVGFGCNSIERRTGAGVKREGTNRIAAKTDYLELLTPKPEAARRIIGDSNQAGTCFGDSGGPMFRQVNPDGLEVAGVTHAGGTFDSYYVSEFTNVADNSGNRDFLARMNTRYGLGIDGI